MERPMAPLDLTVVTLKGQIQSHSDFEDIEPSTL